MDYFDTFAPAATQVSVCLVLHLAAVLGLHARVLDVEQAFVHGELEEQIHMVPPPGLNGVMPTPADKVWRLKRPLYGLKQAPRQWHEKLKEVLLGLGFSPSHGDPSLFIKQSDDGCWVLVYVDDMLLMTWL